MSAPLALKNYTDLPALEYDSFNKLDEPEEDKFLQILATKSETLRGEIAEPTYTAYNFSEFDDFAPEDVPQEDPWWS